MSDDATPAAGSETFAEFKDSFSYGSRNNLDAKFLVNLDEADASAFFEELIEQASEVADGTDDRARAMATFFMKWQMQGNLAPGRYEYDDAPFAELTKPLSDSKVALLTSSGHFVDGDDPEPFGVKNMTQAEAVDRVQEFLKEAPSLSFIPPGTAADQLRVRHGGYPIEGVQADHNVGLPTDHLEAWASNGTIGVYAGAYCFVGACSQGRLNKQTGPEWVELFQREHIDAAVLVPL